MKLLIAGIMGLGLIGCGSGHGHDRLFADAEAETGQRNKIASKLVQKPEGPNAVWSSASLDVLLTLVGLGYDDEHQKLLENYLGADVKSKAKIHEALNISQDGLTIKSANNIWTQKNFELKDEYKETVGSYFDGLEPQQMDVSQPAETAQEINAWAAKHTNNMIKEVVTTDMITPSLVTLLANALYFKGQWDEEFDPKMTEQIDFATVAKAGEPVEIKPVATMKKRKADIEVAKLASDTIVVRLPYKGDSHAMYIAFAAKMGTFNNTEVDPEKDVLKVYEDAVTTGQAFDAEFNPRTYDMFSMPKFTIESKLEGIEGVLAANGYEGLFDSSALDRMTDDRRAKLDFILQKAKIIVNEEGSEAAAVTVGGVRATSVAQPVHLRINGPFAFAIRDDKNKLTLFEGIVRNPESE